jgi:hypothetical protein
MMWACEKVLFDKFAEQAMLQSLRVFWFGDGEMV